MNDDLANLARYPSLQNATVLITGGAGGIGASLVEHFCHQGAHVAFLDVDEQAAEKTVAAINKSTGVSPLFKICDLRDIEQTIQAVKELEISCGNFNILINNAGHDLARDFNEVTPEFWDDRVAVNLRHQYFLIQHLSKSMCAEGQGSIINMGSISWMIGVPGVSVYTTMKSAVMGMTKSLARELGSHGVRVNSIAPGWVLTERQQEKARQFPEKVDQYLEKQCLKELLEPADIAKLALWLAADDSRHMTAQTLIVDGGVI